MKQKVLPLVILFILKFKFLKKGKDKEEVLQKVIKAANKAKVH